MLQCIVRKAMFLILTLRGKAHRYILKKPKRWINLKFFVAFVFLGSGVWVWHLQNRNMSSLSLSFSLGTLDMLINTRIFFFTGLRYVRVF